MTAIDWGWSIEDVMARLMGESTKARENGQRYAFITAQAAAAAVERRRIKAAEVAPDLNLWARAETHSIMSSEDAISGKWQQNDLVGQATISKKAR